MVIAIDKAEPGMELLEDVFLPSGAVLVNAPHVLTASLIETIAKRGIQKIQVASDAKEVQSVPEDPAPEGGGEEPAPSPPQKVEYADDGSRPASPRLTVIVSKDEMSAKLCMEPIEDGSERLSTETIVEALHAEGVVFGIDDKTVAGAMEKWNKFKRYYEIPNIAVGAQPLAGKAGGFECTVQHISDSEKLTAAKAARSFRELVGKGIECKRVDPGTIIARKTDDQKSFPGTTVKGGSVFADKPDPKPLRLDPTVEFGPEDKDIRAKSTGVVFFLDSTIGVCPVNFDGEIDLSVAQDKMKAIAFFHPPGENGAFPSRAAIHAMLWDQKIVFGILDPEIDAILEDCKKGRYPAGPVTLATGVPPVPGENGSIEFLFPLETSLKPKVNKNGTVDYREVDLVVSVKKGQELAKLKPPGKGTPGKDILGRVLPCTNGAPVALPRGQNTEPHPQNSAVLVASTDGIVRYTGSAVEISEGFFIKGNIDFSTGNINYAKTVVVGGDITSGFTVKTGGDLQVAGTIEDADVVVGGNVLCKLGFVGQGKGIVDAKGDVNLAFMKNQTVKSRRHVVIAKEALNCSVFARKTIAVHGNPLSVAGGKMVARDAITVHSIGNSSGVKTLLEVGVDFSLVEELERIEGQLAAMTENKRKLIQTFTKHQNAMGPHATQGSGEEALLVKMKAAITKFDHQIAALEERKKIVVENMYEFKHAHIKIERAALPGTVFKIGSRIFQVKEEIVGPKTVRLIDEEIRILQ